MRYDDDMQQAAVVSWQDAMTDVCNAVADNGVYADADGRFEMRQTPGTAELKVWDLQTGMLVAYSSMRADYSSSLEEFALDYFVD